MPTNSAFIASCRQRIATVTKRMEQAVGGADEALLNRRPDDNTWSPLQVIDHLIMSNRDYIPAMKTALTAAQKTEGDSPVVFSFFGRQIIKAAGPGGNTPVSRKLQPRRARLDLEVIEVWNLQQDQIGRLLDRAAGLNLSRVKICNPLFTLIPLNIADCFEILTVHGERHVAQVEQRMKK